MFINYAHEFELFTKSAKNSFERLNNRPNAENHLIGLVTWLFFRFSFSIDYRVSVLSGLPVYLAFRLQSVLKAAARLTYHLRRSDHITDALVCLHWLRCRSEFSTRSPFWSTKSCTNLRPDSSATSPTYLAADRFVLLPLTVRQCLQWSWQPLPTKRAFPVVVRPRTWNDLPDDVTFAELLSSFRQRPFVNCDITI